MAKWKNFDFKVDAEHGAGMKARFDLAESEWKVTADEKPFLKQAELDREKNWNPKSGYKKFATIPDIVSIEIMQNHGINIHEPSTMQDKDKMARFKKIIASEYKYLMAY